MRKTFALSLLFATLAFAAPNLPFPQAGTAPYFGIKPDNISQAEMNTAVTNFYFTWINKYLLDSVLVPGDYKIKHDNDNSTVSEAMGYGMLFTVYMAGADTNAQKYFDGLNRFRKRYPSSINPNFMEWIIYSNEVSTGTDCATDGDVDIATALLLAYKQWGDESYYIEATNIIKNIEKSLVRSDFSVRLGDWNTDETDTRFSDFITAHFRTFYYATGNPLWTNVENKCYALIEYLQTNYAPSTYLVPDFAKNISGYWEPVEQNFIEGEFDGDYYYNSCRVPWRISTSALYYNEPQAAKVMSGMMNWFYSHCGSPTGVKAGYKLNGDNAGDNNYESTAFISPTGVGAAVITNQSWVNNCFSYSAATYQDYYEDSINLFSLITLSGNLWLWNAGDIPEPSVFLHTLLLILLISKKEKL